MRLAFVGALAVTLLAPWAANAFTVDFDWAGLKPCTSGRPNLVGNPEFRLKDVPQGTAFLRFKLVDRNVPGFDHGGGVVAFSDQAAIAPGAFKYKSPCPPDGVHLYEWQVSAQARKNGGIIARTSASRPYPE